MQSDVRCAVDTVIVTKDLLKQTVLTSYDNPIFKFVGTCTFSDDNCSNSGLTGKYQTEV